MAVNILYNVGCDKKDIVKAGVTSNTLQDLKETKLTVKGILFFDKPDVDTGEIKQVTALKLKDGSFVTSISPTIRNSAELIAESFEEEIEKTGIEIMVCKKKSKSNRDFFYLDLV